jgi:hypothetical protein
MTENPYAAPRAHVEDQVGAIAGDFLRDARVVPASRGWAWISEGFSLFRRQPLTWVLLTVVLVALLIVSGLIPFFGGIVAQLLMPVFTAGLMLGCRQLEEGGELTVGSLFAGFSARPARLIGLGAVGLAAAVLIFVVVGVTFGLGAGAMIGAPSRAIDPEEALSMVLGTLVAVAAGLPVYMAMWFAPALIVLNGLSIGEAIRASFVACARNVLPFLVYGVALLVLMIVALIPLGLGLLVLLPLLFTSVYASYRDAFYER